MIAQSIILLKRKLDKRFPNCNNIVKLENNYLYFIVKDKKRNCFEVKKSICESFKLEDVYRLIDTMMIERYLK